MKIIYIAHPISGNVDENIKSILQIVKHINLNFPHIVPLVPYLADVMALDDSDPDQRARGISNDTAILTSGMVNEVWVFGDYKKSKGCMAEISLAKVQNIPVQYLTFSIQMYTPE